MDSVKNSCLLAVDLERLPAIPAVLLELIEACSQADTSLKQLADIVSQDVVLSAKVLAAANSPLYRQWGEVAGLERQLSVLGVETLKSIAITSAVQQFFSRLGEQHEAYLDGYWYRSLKVAQIARELAILLQHHSEEEAYLAGLLHGLGELALFQLSPDDYVEIAAKPRGLQREEQQRRFAVIGEEVGFHLIDRWHLRSFLADAVRYQDESSEALLDAPQLVKIVHLAQRLAQPDAYDLDQTILAAEQLSGIDPSHIESLVLRVDGRLQQLAGSLELMPLEAGAVREEQALQVKLTTRLELARHVRDFALLSASRQQMAEAASWHAIVNELQYNLGVLFGLKQSMVLRYNPDQERLEGDVGGRVGNKPMDALHLSLEAGKSLAADALLEQRVLHSFDDNPARSHAVVNRQLCHLLGDEGVVCIPLFVGQAMLGVVVAGISRKRLKQLDFQQDFMEVFAQMAAASILRQQRWQEAEELHLNELRIKVQNHARTLLHEANTPLGVINNSLQRVDSKLGSGHAVQAELATIKNELERLGTVLQRMRDPVEEIIDGDGLVDLNRLVENQLAVFKASFCAGDKIKCVKDLDDRLPAIHSHHGRLKQVLANLMKNASEALEEGGTIKLETRDGVNLNGEEFIEISVSDDGPGIPRAVMDELFLPVKSEKKGNHSGTGLAIVKNLVDELEGTISCYSREQEGTRFGILLPRRLVDEPA
ncbi:HDOD domain-containing protein [endosymbiont of Riftia pachyptila]|nr:HDOD domain-containing protein [endosymbiont of Riftia pachyptila]